MKYMLMMHAPRGTGDWQVSNWPPEDLKAHIGFMKRFSKELQRRGRAGRRRGAGGAGAGARSCARRKNGAPEVTDGPFPEAKEFLAGYWIVDVENARARLRDRGARVGGARPGRRAAQHADRSAPGDERAARRDL